MQVSYNQIVLLSKVAGSTVITYEVQPPEGGVWFSTQKVVDGIVDVLKDKKYELNSSFGTTLSLVRALSRILARGRSSN